MIDGNERVMISLVFFVELGWGWVYFNYRSYYLPFLRIFLVEDWNRWIKWGWVWWVENIYHDAFWFLLKDLYEMASSLIDSKYQIEIKSTQLQIKMDLIRKGKFIFTVVRIATMTRSDSSIEFLAITSIHQSECRTLTWDIFDIIMNKISSGKSRRLTIE